MKIVQTPPRYTPHIGGVEVVAQILAERFRDRGHDVEVICAAEPPGAPTEVAGVPVTRLRFPFKVANTNVTPGLVRALWRSDFDVVHTHLPTPWTADVSVLVARARRRRSVVHFHNAIVGDGAAGVVARVYQRTVQRLTFALADEVLCISGPWYDRLLAAYPGLEGKLTLVRNGVDTARYAPPADPSRRGGRFLFVSVLDDFHAYKGLDVLLEALAEAPDAQLDVVGEGVRRVDHEARARELGIADRVRFLGAVGDAELLDLYATSGAFTLPSRTASHEGGSSLVALEAMAAGLPVVLADGAGEIAWRAQEWGAGVRVGSNDVSALAQALQGLSTDGARRTAMGRAAREAVLAHHSWDVVVDTVERLYRP